MQNKRQPVVLKTACYCSTSQRACHLTVVWVSILLSEIREWKDIVHRSTSPGMGLLRLNLISVVTLHITSLKMQIVKPVSANWDMNNLVFVKHDVYLTLNTQSYTSLVFELCGSILLCWGIKFRILISWLYFQ